MALGALIGLVTGNMGLWLALGLVFGASMNAAYAKKNGSSDPDVPPSLDD